MKFGMPTLLEYKSLEDCVADAERFGLDFVEVNLSFPGCNAEELSPERLVALEKKHGVGYTFHADESLNPFDFTKSVSECYFEIMRKTVRLALAVGAPVINMHLLKGVYVTLPSGVVLLTDAYLDDYLTRVREFIALCEEEIGTAPLKIAIENVDSNPFTTSQIRALELFMKSPVFALTLDVGHDACLLGADRHVFEKYPERLMHMHLHDSDGKHAHMALGDGSVDIAGTLARLGEDKTCLIEVKTVMGLEKSLEYLKNAKIIH